MAQQSDGRKCGHKGCKNPIRSDAPIRYCRLHEHEQLAVTPKGQHGFRNATGPGSWQYRLQREKEVEFPQNSAGVKGYPFFTIADLEGHIRYLGGDVKYKPTSDNVLERFPLQSVIMLGKAISGNEVAVIDGDGNIHRLDNKEPEEADEMRGFSVDDGASFLGIADEERYQVVVVDDLAVIDAAVEHGLELREAV